MILSTASFVTTTIAISIVVPIYSDYWCIVDEHISRTCPVQPTAKHSHDIGCLPPVLSFLLRLTRFAIVIAYIALAQANESF